MNLDLLKIEISLQKHLSYFGKIGIRPVGSENLRLASEYIFKTLSSIGYSSTRQPFWAKDVVSENILASKNDPRIVVGAHFDTVKDSPGFIDNASGVAAMLTLSELLFECSADLAFVAFSAEEVGCLGSKHYVSTLSPSQREELLAAITMDVFAPLRGENYALVCNTLGGRVCDRYEIGCEEFPINNSISRSLISVSEDLQISNLCEVWAPRHWGRSDHESFHNISIDSANISWRGGQATKGALPSSYHKAEDSIEQDIDYKMMSRSVALIAGIILDILGV